jgi:hypothetical protein
MHPEQKRIYQLMNPAQKLQVALRYYHSARQLKESFLRSLHPNLTQQEIQVKVREIFFYARS